MYVMENLETAGQMTVFRFLNCLMILITYDKESWKQKGLKTLSRNKAHIQEQNE